MQQLMEELENDPDLRKKLRDGLEIEALEQEAFEKGLRRRAKESIPELVTVHQDPKPRPLNRDVQHGVRRALGRHS